MSSFFSKFILTFSLWCGVWNIGCGVKSHPLPPEIPVEIGRGDANFKKATEGVKLKRTERKKIPDDFEPEDDFKD
jgi:hypothetical protein